MKYIAAFVCMLVLALGVTFLFSSEEVGDQDAVDTGAAPEPTPTTVASTPAPTAEVAAASATPTEEPAITFSMTFSGDVLSHGSVIRQAAAYSDGELAYDYRPMFANVEERLSAADLSFCVLETPVSPDNTELSGYPIFNAPRELPDALVAVGFDGCAVASNHAYDRGPAGVLATLEQMDRAGLGHSGTARSAEEDLSPTLYDANGVSVAHLSFTYGLNGFVLPADQPYLVDVTNSADVLEEARLARAAGADFVVLHLQWGNEYQGDPTPEQLALAQEFTASPDIDLIVGNHVHVIQPVDVVNGKYVIYGLGNFLSNQSAECCPAHSQDGVIATVTVSGTPAEGFEVVDVTFTPTWVDRSNYTIISLPEALADPALDDVTRSVYETSLQRTIETINSLGARWSRLRHETADRRTRRSPRGGRTAGGQGPIRVRRTHQ